MVLIPLLLLPLLFVGVVSVLILLLLLLLPLLFVGMVVVLIPLLLLLLPLLFVGVVMVLILLLLLLVAVVQLFKSIVFKLIFSSKSAIFLLNSFKLFNVSKSTIPSISFKCTEIKFSSHLILQFPDRFLYDLNSSSDNFLISPWVNNVCLNASEIVGL